VLGRETALQPMRWREDGWLTSLTIGAAPDPAPPLPALAPAPWPDPAWDGSFGQAALPLELQWLRTPYPDQLFSLAARPGYLRLYGRETIGSHFCQALVARRQQHFRYTATTRLEFDPADFQQAAGLVCYYNSTKFHYLHVTRDGAARQLQLMTASPDTGGCAMTLVAADLPDGAIELRADVDFDALRFAWRGAGEAAWRRLPETLDASILSDEASLPGLPNFTGAFVGMACQDMSGNATPADFAFFRYEPRR
jgi:xylan 1,4-beta-xylosidase